MDETVPLSHDSSINRLRESRSIRPYPLGVYNFTKLEAEIEEAFGFGVTTAGVMWANQALSMTLFLGVLATAFFDFHTPAVKNSTGLDDHLPIFGLDGIGHFARGIILFHTFCGDGEDCDEYDRLVGLVKTIIIQAALEVSGAAPSNVGLALYRKLKALEQPSLYRGGPFEMETNSPVTNTSVISVNILTVALGYAFAARAMVYLEWHLLYVPALVFILIDVLLLYGPYNYGELYTSIINSSWYLSYNLEVLHEQFAAEIVSNIDSLLS